MDGVNVTVQAAAPNGDVPARLTLIEARQGRMEEAQTAQGTLLAANTAATLEVVDIMNTFKGGMKFLGWMGTAAKWIASIGAAITSVAGVWYLVTHLGGGPIQPK